MTDQTPFDAEDWVGCWNCGGCGTLDDSCICEAFEDTCCCAEPEPPICRECKGKGGWFQSYDV